MFEMILRSNRRPATKTTILLSVVFFFALAAGDAAAQKKFSRTYPAGQNVRLQLMNRSGTVTVEGLSNELEGASRPGHFRGVTTVVAILLNVVRPHFAFFGQKDAQQLLIIETMVREWVPSHFPKLLRLLDRYQTREGSRQAVQDYLRIAEDALEAIP